jgi:hypothetical protein
MKLKIGALYPGVYFCQPPQLRSDEITVRHAHRIIADDLIVAFAAAVVVFL